MMRRTSHAPWAKPGTIPVTTEMVSSLTLEGKESSLKKRFAEEQSLGSSSARRSRRDPRRHHTSCHSRECPDERLPHLCRITIELTGARAPIGFHDTPCRRPRQATRKPSEPKAVAKSLVLA